MLCFITYLPLMIGDLVPMGNKFWKIIIILSKIVNLIMRNEFNEKD